MLILGTIRLSLSFFTVSLALELGRFTAPVWRRTSLFLWTAGCVLIWLHIAAALHFHYHDSLAHAAAETSRQTRELLGWSPGGELYYNFAFAAAWTADAARRWYWPPPRRGWGMALRAVTYAYLLFIAVCATIVFEDGATRMAGVAGGVLLAGMFLVGRRKPLVTE